MLRFNKQLVPQYIQDLENGKFAEVNEDDGNEIFAYYIDPTIGRASANVGSICAKKNDPLVQFLNDDLCVKMYKRLSDVRKKRLKSIT